MKHYPSLSQPLCLSLAHRSMWSAGVLEAASVAKPPTPAKWPLPLPLLRQRLAHRCVPT